MLPDAFFDQREGSGELSVLMFEGMLHGWRLYLVHYCGRHRAHL
jgi:hypothetical protein